MVNCITNFTIFDSGFIDFSHNHFFWFVFLILCLDWHVGVRVVKSGLLVGFISAIPSEVRVHTKTVKSVEINFLCVHKKLRAKRVAPVLIREITRRVNLTGIFQAVYTAGVVLPKPIATCRYWHRSLNPKKLIQVNWAFSAWRAYAMCRSTSHSNMR